MRLAIAVAILILGFFNISYCAYIPEADTFSKQYEQEVKTKKATAQEEMEKSIWRLEIKEKIGVASYEEDEQGISSDYQSFFSEFLINAVNDNESDIEKSISFSYGQSGKDKETWKVSGIKLQDDDMNFYRINLEGSIGKILYSDRYKDLRVIPFLGYGFRFINFKRSNFNILDIITLEDVVSEKYYIQHADFGVRFDFPVFSKLDIAGFSSFGYVFYNQAVNSELGKINGGGGYIVNLNLDLLYKINESWQLVFGGIAELEHLSGGRKGDIIWPDNDLNIYTGNIGARFIF